MKGKEIMKEVMNLDGVMFYYLRDERMNINDKKAKKGMPFGVVAIRENEDGTVNRGVSICSPGDRYNKVAGRGIALKRLMEAEEKKDNIPFGYYTGEECKQKITNFPFMFKSSYRDVITKFEHRMFHKPEDR